MNFSRIKLVFYLLALQLSLFAQGDDLAPNSCGNRSPQRITVNKTEPVPISLCKSEIDRLTNFLHLTHDTLSKLSNNNTDSAYFLPAKQLLKEYSDIKDILIRINNGASFHPTPESDRILQRHIAAISELSPEEFQQGSPENYMNNLNHPYGSASFPTPYEHTAVLTPKWLTLASILHDNNFERSLECSPHSPSGTANWHHAFQTHDVVHLIPRSVHRDHHGELHPITANSQIDRQAFSCERLRLNQSWALLAATRSIASELMKYSNDDDHYIFLKKCASLYSSTNSSSELTPNLTINDNLTEIKRNLNEEYDNNDQDRPITKLSETKKDDAMPVAIFVNPQKLAHNLLEKKKYVKSAHTKKRIIKKTLNQNLANKKTLRKNL